MLAVFSGSGLRPVPVFFLSRKLRLSHKVLVAAPRLGADAAAGASQKCVAMGVDVDGSRYVVSGADGDRVVDVDR